MMTDEPQCDFPGCDSPGYSRYRHIHTHEWIDVCYMHKPTASRGGGHGHVCGSSIWHHTIHHPAYPAESPSEVNSPKAFIRQKKLAERQAKKSAMPKQRDDGSDRPVRVVRASGPPGDCRFDSDTGHWGGPTAHETMTQTTMTETQDDAESRWSKRAILRRLPYENRLNDRQKKLLVTAIRNPDAGTINVQEHVGGGSLDNLLRQIARGFYETEGGDYHPRLNKGSAAFKERTVKQRAAIDFHARHPKAFDDATYEQVAAKLQEELGVALHPMTIYNVRSDYPGLIDKRRKWYESNEPDAIERLDIGSDKSRREDERTLREKLHEAGFDDLPDKNLDGLMTAHKAKQEGQERGLERAHERTREDGPFGVAADRAESSSADGGPQAAVAEGESVEQQRGQTTYKGPEGGLDLTGGRAPKLLRPARDDDAADEAVADAIAQVREEEGEFGEKAYQRDVNIDSKDDLELEVRRLRMVIASQGDIIRSLKRALENLTVDVNVGVELPSTEGGDDDE